MFPRWPWLPAHVELSLTGLPGSNGNTWYIYVGLYISLEFPRIRPPCTVSCRFFHDRLSQASLSSNGPFVSVSNLASIDILKLSYALELSERIVHARCFLFGALFIIYTADVRSFTLTSETALKWPWAGESSRNASHSVLRECW